jgi:co-chaperonin GroES (HSP10)
MKYSLPEFSAVGETSAVPEGTDEQKASQIPEPKTYHLLCMLPEAKDAYDSGILKADKTMQFEELLSPVLFVAKMGPDAFKDEKRFPSGPSCKVGDFVIVRPNSGTRMKIHGTEFRIVNDDSVEATIEDPRGLGRV